MAELPQPFLSLQHQVVLTHKMLHHPLKACYSTVLSCIIKALNPDTYNFFKFTPTYWLHNPLALKNVAAPLCDDIMWIHSVTHSLAEA